MLVFVIVTLVFAVLARFSKTFGPPESLLKGTSSSWNLFGYYLVYLLIGAVSATLFCLILFPFSTLAPSQLVYTDEWNDPISFSILRDCEAHDGIWRCGVLRPSTYTRDVVLKETREVTEPVVHYRAEVVSEWIAFLRPRKIEKEILLPIGGLERHYLEQLRPAQEHVFQVEQKLRQVREFYQKKEK